MNTRLWLILFSATVGFAQDCAAMSSAHPSRWDQLHPGQTTDQVIALLGTPDRMHGKNMFNADWYYAFPDKDTLIVRFAKGNLRDWHIKYLKRPRAQRSGPGKWEQLLGVGGLVYLGYVCPQVRNKPLLLWTANDIQTYRLCVANWF